MADRADQLGFGPAQYPLPRRIDRLDDYVIAILDDDHHVLAEPPHPVSVGRPFGDTRLQRLVEGAQRRFRVAPLCDVGIGADPADDLAFVVAHRHGPRQEPAIDAIGAPKPEFDLVRRSAGDRFAPGLSCKGQVFRMDDRCPSLAVQRSGLRAGIFINAAVEPVQLPVRLACPGVIRYRLRQGAKLSLALAQQFFGLALLGNIGIGAEPAHDIPVFIPDRCDPRQKRAVLPVGASQRKHHLERNAGRNRRGPSFHHRRQGVGGGASTASPSPPYPPASHRHIRTSADCTRISSRFCRPSSTGSGSSSPVSGTARLSPSNAVPPAFASSSRRLRLERRSGARFRRVPERSLDSSRHFRRRRCA